MPKTINYENLEHVKITLDMPFREAEDEWYIARATASCDAVSANGDRRSVQTSQTIGTKKATQPTFKAIYTQMNLAGPSLAALLKDLVTEALDEDVTN